MKGLLPILLYMIVLQVNAQDTDSTKKPVEPKPAIFNNWPGHLKLNEATVSLLFSSKLSDTVHVAFSDTVSVKMLKIMQNTASGNRVAAFKILWGPMPVLHIEDGHRQKYNGFILHKEASDAYRLIPGVDGILFEKVQQEKIVIK